MHKSATEKPVTCHLTQLNDSLAIIIPKQFVTALALHENDKVTISINAH